MRCAGDTKTLLPRSCCENPIAQPSRTESPTGLSRARPWTVSTPTADGQIQDVGDLREAQHAVAITGQGGHREPGGSRLGGILDDRQTARLPDGLEPCRSVAPPSGEQDTDGLCAKDAGDG